jgi:putative ABC transport system permease protein
MGICESAASMSRLDAFALRAWRLHLAESLQNLRAMGQRSWLALLGIVVGSASVVALLDIGRSASEDAISTFKGMGTDALVASFPDFPRRIPPLPKILDTRRVQQALPDLAQIAPISQYSARVSRAGTRFDASVIGTTAALAPVMDVRLASGRFLSPLDGNSLFAVVGAEAAAVLRGAGPPLQLGELLRIGDYQFQIIGVLAPQLHNPLLPVAADESVFIPASSVSRLSSTVRIGNVIARVIPGADLQRTAHSFETLLSEQLGGREVNVQIPRQLLDGLKRQADIFAWLLAGLGGISLLVAGVGVMNVMLMSVRERRREIGVRLALGARPRDIHVLFLLEAAHLSVAGALLGALLGSFIAWGFTRFSGWPLHLSLDAMALGIGSSLLIGLFFGSYPAAVASRLSPAQALRDD